MIKASAAQTAPKEMKDLEAALLDHSQDKYKLVRNAVRWAWEIKQSENLPDSIISLMPRSLNEILTGQVTLEKIEKMPDVVHAAASSPPALPAAPLPTISLKTEKPEKEKDGKSE